MLKQYYLTVAEGKRLIAKAIAQDVRVLKAAKEHTLVITGGTTNGYIVEELFKAFDLGAFDKSTFFRGIYKGPELAAQSEGRDVIIREGKLVEGMTIVDIEPELNTGDMILKGGNAVNVPDGEAGVVIGNPKFGTMDPITRAVYGRRVKLIVPIGLEKRVDIPITELVDLVCDPEMPGTRLAFAPGEVYTELDALETTGVDAYLIGGGGVGGFEGSVLIAVEGEADEVAAADALVKSVKGEPKFGF